MTVFHSVWSHRTVRLCACDNSYQPASPKFKTGTAITASSSSTQVFVVPIILLLTDYGVTSLHPYWNSSWRIWVVWLPPRTCQVFANHPDHPLAHQDCLSLDQLTQLVIGSSSKSMTTSTTFDKAVRSSGSTHVRPLKDKWRDGLFANDRCMLHERGCLAGVVTLSWRVSLGAGSNSYLFLGNWISWLPALKTQSLRWIADYCRYIIVLQWSR